MHKTIEKKTLVLSTIDGTMSTVMGSLTGGIFLTGFALQFLHARPIHIGLLASVPLLTQCASLLSARLIDRTGSRKTVTLVSALLSRLVWLGPVLLPFIPLPPGISRIWLFIGMVALSGLIGSISGVAWLSWISDLIPEKIRGTYFGRRNMIASFFGMASVLIAGKLLTSLRTAFGGIGYLGYTVIFAAGLIAGIIGLVAQLRIPDVPMQHHRHCPAWHSLLTPFRNHGFIRLLAYVAAWQFATQLAGPFYGVYMINDLKLSLAVITLLGAAATMATMLMMRIWGPISDKLGNRPILILATWVLSLVPLTWLVVLPETGFLPLLIVHIMAGAFTAGATLSQFNILIKLVPREGHTTYYAVFAAVTGLIGSLAPLTGGVVMSFLDALHLPAGYPGGIQMIFLLSAAIQLIGLPFILRIPEPSAASPKAVIARLGNDLNPQTGVANATDFVILKVQESNELLTKLDRHTDKFAEKSEQIIGEAVEFSERLLGKPVRFLVRLLLHHD